MDPNTVLMIASDLKAALSSNPVLKHYFQNMPLITYNHMMAHVFNKVLSADHESLNQVVLDIKDAHENVCLSIGSTEIDEWTHCLIEIMKNYDIDESTCVKLQENINIIFRSMMIESMMTRIEEELLANKHHVTSSVMHSFLRIKSLIEKERQCT